MNLWAISDLHLGIDVNRRAIERVASRPEDWLILAGDIGDSEEELALAFEVLAPRFARLIWVPGNHELWTDPRTPGAPRGVRRYAKLIELAGRYRVTTPEDPYPIWPGAGPKTVIAPLLLLYDYSVRRVEVPRDRVVAWAAEAGIIATDERGLDPEPFADIAEWCAHRLQVSAHRLETIPADAATILVNHYPLRPEDVVLPRKPRYAPWCGTRATSDWHRRYRARAVVYGHLHVRASRFAEGVHFQEVSLGYARDWDHALGADAYVRRVL